MALHLLKLAVGAESLDSLRAWVAQQAAASAAAGGPRVSRAKTRMSPKRVDEVLAGGSLYWVIKGALQGRQEIVGFEPFNDENGIKRLHIMLEPEVIAVRPRPCRPFQGWRYLTPEDAPADWRAIDLDDDIPATMRRELMELCLI
ncbi:DUF1489 domain-containing protein [Acuticoccus sp. MNP-M23]|uniref:DUF1489 family protein n=1 Tax=Acuticoccus sp. MNP-M23 TaxID=3072793 RepID=UPI0028168D70|nr:DUF1489 domain-containing protein [Acuticoccus sp. MNP-M23]WMS42860.1 DUF1489 domain-containing protein [Acuticoccus sp. MNP-M23]